MINLDHILIAVPDVDGAVEQLGHTLGLIFAPPSYHTGSGTYNRMARFANGTSIELLGITDREGAAAVAGMAHDLSYFDKGPSQFGFALRSDDIAALVAQAKTKGGSLSEPSYGEAKMPDGNVRAWQNVHVEGLDDSQFLVVPFVLQYTKGWGPEIWKPQGLLEHELDYEGIAGISITAKAAEIADIYQRNFGLEFSAKLNEATRCSLAHGFIETMEGSGDYVGGSLKQFYPPQVHTIFLRVPDLHEVTTKLRAWKVEFVEDLRFAAPALRIDPQATLGLHFALVDKE